MQNFKNKRVVITGGSSGIGLATAKLFKKCEADVIITARNGELLEKEADQLGVRGILADQSTHEGIMKMVTESTKNNAKVDVLFINAGIFKLAPITEVDASHLDEQMNINFRGAFFTLKTFIPHLNEGGSVIFLSSIVAETAMANTVAYSASKAALNALARVAAIELAPRRIRVNIVSPGPIDTPIWTKVSLTGTQIGEMNSGIKNSIPLKRFGDPAEVANAVAFLASDEASFITGTDLKVSGGLHLNSLS